MYSNDFSLYGYIREKYSSNNSIKDGDKLVFKVIDNNDNDKVSADATLIAQTSQYSFDYSYLDVTNQNNPTVDVWGSSIYHNVSAGSIYVVLPNDISLKSVILENSSITQSASVDNNIEDTKLNSNYHVAKFDFTNLKQSKITTPGALRIFKCVFQLSPFIKSGQYKTYAFIKINNADALPYTKELTKFSSFQDDEPAYNTEFENKWVDSDTTNTFYLGTVTDTINLGTGMYSITGAKGNLDTDYVAAGHSDDKRNNKVSFKYQMFNNTQNDVENAKTYINLDTTNGFELAEPITLPTGITGKILYSEKTVDLSGNTEPQNTSFTDVPSDLSKVKAIEVVIDKLAKNTTDDIVINEKTDLLGQSANTSHQLQGKMWWANANIPVDLSDSSVAISGNSTVKTGVDYTNAQGQEHKELLSYTKTYQDGDDIVSKDDFDVNTIAKSDSTLKALLEKYDYDSTSIEKGAKTWQTDEPNSTWDLGQTAQYYIDGDTVWIKLKHKVNSETVTKEVKRPITVKNPDETTTDLTQTVTLTGTKQTDAVTGKEITATWTPGKFDKKTIPTKEGYTPSETTIPELTVTTPDQKIDPVTVTYTANDQTLTIKYVDDDDSTKVIPAQTVNGKTGDTITPTYDIPAGYEIASGKLDSYTFKANGNEFTVHLKHEHTITPLSQEVSRSITITKPDGTKVDKSQKTTLTGSRDTDEVTKSSTDTWNKSSFNEVEVPTVAGYTPSQSEIPAVEVAHDSKFDPINVTYTADPQQIKIIYQDKDNGDKEVPNSSQTIDGKTGETITPTYNVPTNYDVVSGNDKTYKFTADKNQTITVVVKHHHDTSDETTTVKRPITVKNPDGTTTDLTQTVTLTGKKDTDKVTGESTTTWTPGEFGEVTIPTVPGYTPSITKIDKAPATADGQSPVTTVTYTADHQTVKVVYVDNTDQVVGQTTVTGATGQALTSGDQLPAGYALTGGNQSYQITAAANQTFIVKVHRQTQSATVEQPGAKLTHPTVATPKGVAAGNDLATKQSARLPQTGNVANPAKYLGLLLAGLSLNLGLGGKFFRKHRQQH